MVELKARKKAVQQAKERPASASSDARAEKIGNHLGVKVKVHTSTRGSGDIVIKFKNEKEFERLCSILTA